MSDEQNEVLRELRATVSELREGAKLWRETLAARLEAERAALETQQLRQRLNREAHDASMEDHRAYRQNLEEQHKARRLEHDSRLENDRLWREGHQRSEQRRPGRNIAFFVLAMLLGWFLLVSVYLFNWLCYHTNVIRP